MNKMNVLEVGPSSGYELLDSGDGEKLERFGSVVLSRPDPQALWRKNMPESEWKKADGHFNRDEAKGDWTLSKKVPEKWSVEFESLKFWIKPTAFKHTGLFPEQASNWKWLGEKCREKGGAQDSGGVEVLNLFGYTGGATLACAKAGAKVVHIDGSKSAVNWARENAEASGLKDKPIRWIVEDARTFVKREVKRERKYDGIIMDPPAFGHGPENEIWKIEDHFMPLLEDCFKLFKDKPLFFLVNGYSAGYSALAYENALKPLLSKYGGNIEVGELAIKEKASGRDLPAGIYARWSQN